MKVLAFDDDIYTHGNDNIELKIQKNVKGNCYEIAFDFLENFHSKEVF